MNQQGPQQNFMDSKTIMAIVLVGLFWLGWQWHLQQKYPDAYGPKKSSTKVSQNGVPNGEGMTEGSQNGGEHQVGNKNAVSGSGLDSEGSSLNLKGQKNDEVGGADHLVPEQLIRVDNDEWTFEVSSIGMGIRNLVLKKYTDRKDQPVVVGSSSGEFLPFSLSVAGFKSPLHFEMQEQGKDRIVGQANFGSLVITKILTLNSQSYSMDTEIKISGKDDRLTGLTVYLLDKVRPSMGGSFFMPYLGKHEFFIHHKDGEDRVVIDDEGSELESFSQVNVASISTQYFAQALIDKSPVIPNTKTSVNPVDKRAQASIQYLFPDSGKWPVVRYTAFMGPKYLDLMKNIDAQMAGIIDFGIFSGIAVYILDLLKWMQTFLGNWGLAIILMTLLVRLVLMPLNIMSFKSMKNMQKIQPLLQSVREKYKDEPQRMNQEVMAIMRSHKVNPLGGCLPMLLQFPIFIALYSVLGQSIELYKAPFTLWIHDLSLKDPYYVLPVLMGLTLFFQQKLTPSTLDATQAKIIMYLMPVIFTVFMVSLPSGLTLYIFVSGLFAVVQQYFLMKEKRQEAALTS